MATWNKVPVASCRDGSTDWDKLNPTSCRDVTRLIPFAAVSYSNVDMHGDTGTRAQTPIWQKLPAVSCRDGS